MHPQTAQNQPARRPGGPKRGNVVTNRSRCATWSWKRATGTRGWTSSIRTSRSGCACSIRNGRTRSVAASSIRFPRFHVLRSSSRRFTSWRRCESRSTRCSSHICSLWTVFRGKFWALWGLRRTTPRRRRVSSWRSCLGFLVMGWWRCRLQKMSNQLGLKEMNARFQSEELKPQLTGLFPTENSNDVRFAINFYTSIGLGGLTKELRETWEKLRAGSKKKWEKREKRTREKRTREKRGEKPGRNRRFVCCIQNCGCWIMECAYCGEYHQETVKSLAEKSTFVMVDSEKYCHF